MIFLRRWCLSGTAQKLHHGFFGGGPHSHSSCLSSQINSPRLFQMRWSTSFGDRRPLVIKYFCHVGPFRMKSFSTRCTRFNLSTCERAQMSSFHTGTLQRRLCELRPTVCRLFSTKKDSRKSDQNEEEEIRIYSEERLRRRARSAVSGLYVLVGLLVGGSCAALALWGPETRDSHGRLMSDVHSGSSLAYLFRWVVEPSRSVLLPDPLKPPFIQPKYTLVLEIKNILINPDWTYQTGWRFKKRPAIEYFLNTVQYPNFEVVVYTSETGATAEPILQSFDPAQRIMFRLYRDTTKYMNGHHVKDVSKLNRSLSRVIHLDCDVRSTQLHPENALLVVPWSGDMDDTALVDLAELLKTIYLSDVDDVRPTLQYYSQFDDPAKEFRKRATFLAEQQQQQQHVTSVEQQRNLAGRYAGKLFGYRRHS